MESAPMDGPFEMTPAECEAMLRSFRELTGCPVVVPPAFYAEAKRLGMDLSNITPTPLIPTGLQVGPRLSSKGLDVGLHYNVVAIEIVDALDR